MTTLEISIRRNEGALWLGQSLRDNTHLTSLSLLLGGERLSEQGMQDLIQGMSSSQICHLTLTLCRSLTSMDTERAFLCSLPRVTTIQHLHYRDERFVLAWHALLSSMPSLRAMTVSNMISFPSFQSLARGLTHTTSLQVLKLFGRQNKSLHTRFQTKSQTKGRMIALGKALHPKLLQQQHHYASTTATTSVTTLDLCECMLTDADVEVFCNYWPHRSNLACLKLNFNHIGLPGIQALIHAIPLHSTLQTLHLNTNLHIGYQGLQLIGKALPCLRLRELRLRECVRGQLNNNRGHHHHALLHQARQDAACALLKGINNNTYMHVLDVVWNHFGADVERKVFLCTLRNRFLLFANENEMLPTVWCHMLARCQRERDPHSLVYFFFREHPNLIPS